MSQINSNTKDDFQVVFLLSCFVGHPVTNEQCFKNKKRLSSSLLTVICFVKHPVKKSVYVLAYYVYKCRLPLKKGIVLISISKLL